MKLVWLAIKDLRLLFRDKMATFFVIGFPVLLGIFFGVIFPGPDSGTRTGKLKVMLVDQDGSSQSQRLIAELEGMSGIELEQSDLETARQRVRLGERSAMIVLPEKFGETAGIAWQTQPAIQIGVDPSRAAEGAMLEGMIMQASGALMAARFQQPAEFLPFIDQAQRELSSSEDVDPAQRFVLSLFFNQVKQMIGTAEEIQSSSIGASEETATGFSFNLVNLEKIDVTSPISGNGPGQQLKKIRSSWDISFPQAMMWGIMGCVAGFSMSIARERSRGTFVRLQAAPLSSSDILAGKALACFLACLLVLGLLTLLGLLLGMRPLSFTKLLFAAVATSCCFVGIMMTLSVLGKTEESVAGTGWAANIVMAMFGGAMVPVMFMPSFLQPISKFSPIYWTLSLIEGAIWRDFSWLEMLPATCVLVGIAIAGTILGGVILHRSKD